MLAHDLSIGPTYDLAFANGRSFVAFVRAHAGVGVTFATRQIQSRDGGHIYSDTDPAFNWTATLEVGARHSRTGLEAFLGAGYLWNTAIGMSLKQDHVTLASRETALADVTRRGALLYAGLGLEL